MVDDKNQNAIRIYDLIAEDYAKNFDGIDSPEDMIFPDVFLSYLEKGSHIVDLGCGTGFSSGYFVKHGMTAEGADLSKSMIAIATRNFPKIPFLIADMREFMPSQKPDAVWAGYSLFHFGKDDLVRTLERIKTYLKSNGVFGLVVQEGVGEIERDEPFLSGEKIYIHLYTEKELTRLLEDYGFSVIDVRRKIPRDGSEFPYDKLLLIAKLQK
jgi:predicted TPR repeat methyltransferase